MNMGSIEHSNGIVRVKETQHTSIVEVVYLSSGCCAVELGMKVQIDYRVWNREELSETSDDECKRKLCSASTKTCT